MSLGEGRQRFPRKHRHLWFKLCLGFKILLFQIPFCVLLVDVFVGFSNENKPAWRLCSGSGSGPLPFAAALERAIKPGFLVAPKGQLTTSGKIDEI